METSAYSVVHSIIGENPMSVERGMRRKHEHLAVESLGAKLVRNHVLQTWLHSRRVEKPSIRG